MNAGIETESYRKRLLHRITGTLVIMISYIVTVAVIHFMRTH